MIGSALRNQRLYNLGITWIRGLDISVHADDETGHSGRQDDLQELQGVVERR